MTFNPNEESDIKYDELLVDEDEATVSSVCEELKTQGIINVDYYLDGNEYKIMVGSNEYIDAKVKLDDYLRHELESEEESNDSAPFEQASVKSRDVKSSAYSLILVGLIGFALIGLQYAGIFGIELDPNTQWIFYLSMGALFLLFLILGFISLKKSSRFEKAAKEEDNLTDRINEFITLNVDNWDMSITVYDGLSDEEKYFNRCAYIADKINEEFGQQSEGYIDFILEQIYPKIYES